MSLILDALNRADQERSENNKPISLQAGHPSSVSTNSPIRRWIIEGVIIILAIAAFVYSQWQPSPLPTVPIINTTATNTVTLKPTVTTSEPAVVKPPKAATVISDKIVKQEAIVSLYQQPQTVEKTPAISIAPKTRPDTEKSADTTQLILQQIPLLTQLSARYQRTIPSIDYELHMYAENGRGFVTINGAVLKTGSVIDSGLRVIAVLHDSVVLEFKGKQFRLPALNSWVNYN